MCVGRTHSASVPRGVGTHLTSDTDCLPVSLHNIESAATGVCPTRSGCSAYQLIDVDIVFDDTSCQEFFLEMGKPFCEAGTRWSASEVYLIVNTHTMSIVYLPYIFWETSNDYQVVFGNREKSSCQFPFPCVGVPPVDYDTSVVVGVSNIASPSSSWFDRQYNVILFEHHTYSHLVNRALTFSLPISLVLETFTRKSHELGAAIRATIECFPMLTHPHHLSVV